MNEGQNAVGHIRFLSPLALEFCTSFERQLAYVPTSIVLALQCFPKPFSLLLSWLQIGTCCSVLVPSPSALIHPVQIVSSSYLHHAQASKHQPISLASVAMLLLLPSTELLSAPYRKLPIAEQCTYCLDSQASNFSANYSAS